MNIEVGKKYQRKHYEEEIIEVLFIADRGDGPIFAIHDDGTTLCFSVVDIEEGFKPYEEPEEKTLEQRIKEAYPDYEVRVCDWLESNNWSYKNERGVPKVHYMAVSKRGFDGYVYENIAGALYVLSTPFDGKLPVACLFEEVDSEWL